MTTDTNPQIVAPIPLDDGRALDPDVVGTKAATLARLAGLGHPVPPGVVVPAGTVGLDGRPPPATTVSSLGETVAVRSSAVAEDLAHASFAGQYRTVLGVDARDGDALGAAIAEVVASVESAHARSYAAGHDAADAGMAVLVQHQIAPRAAGVAFSADPVTGDDVVLVSAVHGLGEALVSGEVTPEDWRIEPGAEARRSHGAMSVLDAADADRVAELTRRVADDLAVAVDIEWAIADDGGLHLLQARPVTALPRRPVLELPTEGTWEKDTSHMCEPLTPIAETMWLPPMEAALAETAETYGLMIDGMDFLCLGGELYSHPRPPGGKEGAAPPWWLLGIVARLAPSMRRKLKAAREAVSSGVPERTIDRWYETWKPELTERIGTLRAVDLEALEDAELRRHLDQLSGLFVDAHRIHFLLFVPYLMGIRPFVELADEQLGWSTSEALALLDGLSDTSSAPTRHLRQVAATVNADPTARSVLLGWAGEPLDDVLRALAEAGAHDAAAGIVEHLADYGCRVTAFDPGRPTIDERPGLVLGVLRDLVSDGTGPDELGDGLERRRAEGEASMEAAAVERKVAAEDRQRLRAALADARRVWPVREDNLFFTDALPSGLVRRAMLEVGRRLVARGELGRPDDACWLELAEVHGSLGGRSVDGGEPLAERVQRRRAERAWVQAHPGPVTLGDPPEDPPDLRGLPEAVRQTTGAMLWAFDQEFSHATDGPVDGVAGTPASPGRYTGPVRVVRGDADFASIRPGDVLVCPITTPAWSLNFSRVGALVTDAGGALSHAAIVAREHAIPAVVATGCATTELHDDQIVTVDGVAGTVVPTDG